MQGQWQGQWDGEWLGATAGAGGNPVAAAALSVIGASISVFTATLINREPLQPRPGGSFHSAPWKWVQYNPTHKPRPRKRRQQDLLFLQP
jgi:hypothetical protein